MALKGEWSKVKTQSQCDTSRHAMNSPTTTTYHDGQSTCTLVQQPQATVHTITIKMPFTSSTLLKLLHLLLEDFSQNHRLFSSFPCSPFYETAINSSTTSQVNGSGIGCCGHPATIITDRWGTRESYIDDPMATNTAGTFEQSLRATTTQ